MNYNDRSLLFNYAEYSGLYDNFYHNKRFLFHYDNDKQSEEVCETPVMHLEPTLNEISYNIIVDNNVEENINQFFNDYIGDNYGKIHEIFYIGNSKQDFNDIYSILRDNRVIQYIAIWVVEDELNTTIAKIYETFESTKQSEEELKLNLKIECLHILSIEYDIIRRANKKLMNINKELYNGEIENNIYDILKQCIDDRKQYLDTRLKEITNTDNLKNICQKYIKHHNNDKQNSNDKNL